MAALFAIQIKEFPHDDKGMNFDGSWVGKYMGKEDVVLVSSVTDYLAAGEFTTIGAVLLITIAVLRFRRSPQNSVGFQPRDGQSNEQGDKLEFPKATVDSLKSQADQIPEADLFGVEAEDDELPNPQHPASTNVSPKKTWLRGMGFGGKSGSGVSAPRKRNLNLSSV
jgi:hypothetical protein